MFDKEFVMKKLAENIRVERARKHYSQEFLAEKSDITPQHLYRIENEKVCPTVFVAANIAKALDVTLNDLFLIK
ncbi:MAG: helix-turn-helix domain-containing protein [Candidatus Gastranaerophilales bacterium]|nr:helix-turn-helix domain-containing protein [Candidatus Gastranaerophilales bacterium]